MLWLDLSRVAQFEVEEIWARHDSIPNFRIFVLDRLAEMGSRNNRNAKV
jgi:hypothetical protein